ncbi:hypothetical protein FGL98_21455 [Leekyejoonella antrihumi]|uniref:Barstar (barnase inhibitor) domain-containing protein n=1 Tax=Leekyejoonella antrihumi TaxID=1660198 RepID=A0A563DT78_9MICO|nr:hypothetical protein FGL98_21455 [Leekyejoonella antrihumi]
MEITLTRPTDKAALLRAFQGAFGLPDWFGHNWDALVDSLRDVQPAQGQPGVLVVWSGSALVGDDDRRTAVEILRERAQQRGSGFKLALGED